MICYQDRTFCITPGCTKEHALTDEVRKAAQALKLPISTAYLCGGASAPNKEHPTDAGAE
jgi:hypothetical protein